MTKKKAVVFLEGNQRQQEAFVHELTKLVSEANAQPELTASLQTTDVVEEPEEPHFESGGDNGP